MVIMVKLNNNRSSNDPCHRLRLGDFAKLSMFNIYRSPAKPRILYRFKFVNRNIRSINIVTPKQRRLSRTQSILCLFIYLLGNYF